MTPPFPSLSTAVASLTSILLCCFSAGANAYDKAQIVGCAQDIMGNRISGAEVRIEGVNYQGGYEYQGEGGWAKTESDGSFKIAMKKSVPGAFARARLTIWSTIAGTRSKGRGGVYERLVENKGEDELKINSGECIEVPASYFIGGIVTGKDMTQRDGSHLRLKMEAPDQGDYGYADILGDGRFEFNPWFDKDVLIRVKVDKSPLDEICVVTPASLRTGKTGVTDNGRFVMDFKVTCGPNSAFFSRCDGLQRDVSAALVAKEPDRASGLLDQMESECGRNHPKYSEGMTGARQQISALRAGPLVLTRRSDNSASSMFQGAIAQSEQEERDRPAREAREKADGERVAEQRRLASVQRSAAAPAAPPMSAQDRLIASYDQRISATRQQCATSEGSCNTGCVGIGAVGIFSALAGNRAAAGATQEQLQQCSNRCDQAKNECDQQVAALEQEKQQALTGDSNPGSSWTAGTSGAVSANGSCDPDPSLMMDYVRFQNAFYARTGGMAPGAIRVSRTSPEEAKKLFADFRKSLLSQDAQGLKNFIAYQEKTVAQPINSFPQYMDGATQQTVARIYIQMAGCLIRQKEAVASTPARGVPVSGSGAACAATPQESFRNFNGELLSFGNRYPNQSARGGSRDQYQYSIFYGSSGLQILEKYRSCLTAADYQANKKALENARDKGRQGCEQLSSSQGTCTPTYPSNWRG